VTRQLVLEIAPTVGVPIEERDVPVDALLRADEAFVTSTVRELQPVSRVDGVVLAAPGPVTEKLAAAFTDLTRRAVDP
jgi:branched-chain amino acid aminotransferase